MPETPAIRILYLIDEIKDLRAGGTERQVLQMISLTRQAGLEPHLCVFRGSEWLDPSVIGCPVHRAEYKRFLSLAGIGSLFGLLRWTRRNRFHIVQSFFVEANLIGPPLARLARTPVVLGSRRNLNYWASRPVMWAQRFSNLFANRLVANSEAVRHSIAASEGTRPDKIDVIYNGVDTGVFRPHEEQRRETRKRLDLTDQEVLIGNVSNLAKVKGIRHFVHAAGLLSKQLPEARFLLVGDGPLRGWVESEMQALHLPGRFHLAGGKDEIVPYLNACDIAVLSSDSEGFSNSLLEYMAAGLPCVATDVGGNREALGEEAGLLVPPRDPAALAEAIARLVRDPERRRQMGAAARARAETRFGLAHAQRELVAYYTRLLRG